MFNPFLITLGSYVLPRGVALRAARFFLATQGFGAQQTPRSEAGAFRHLPERPVVFDVGAHKGEFAAHVLQHRPFAEIVMFEPSAIHRTLITPGLGKVEPFALGDFNGMATLYKDEAVTGMASMGKRNLDFAGKSMDLEEAIEVRTLDAYLKKSGNMHIDLLKIDVEGFEASVLRGAKASLKHVRAVQFEYGSTYMDTRTHLRDVFTLLADFDIYIIKPNGALARLDYHPFYENNMFCNYLALNRSPAA